MAYHHELHAISHLKLQLIHVRYHLLNFQVLLLSFAFEIVHCVACLLAFLSNELTVFKHCNVFHNSLDFVVDVLNLVHRLLEIQGCRSLVHLLEQRSDLRFHVLNV